MAQDAADWDLADFCLERCAQPINRIATAMGIPLEQTNLRLVQQHAEDPGLVSSQVAGQAGGAGLDQNTDILLPVDGLDFPWEALWDGFDNSGLLDL
jgi:hypothetical protein